MITGKTAKIIRKILNGLRKKAILSFEKVSDNRKKISSFLCYGLKLEDKISITVRFFSSETCSPGRCDFAEAHARGASILIGKDCPAKKIRALIKRLISEVLQSIRLETEFKEDVIYAIKKNPYQGLHGIEKSNALDDIGGVDFWLLYKLWRIGVQLKSSPVGQEIHRREKTGEKVSSIVYKRGMYSIDNLFRNLMKICKAKVMAQDDKRSAVHTYLL